MKLWWKFEGKFIIKDIIQGLKNLIKWFPIIWKDRDWDYRYIYDILKLKLENQAKYIGSKGIHTTAKRDAEIMMTCVRLIDKIKDEEYVMEYMNYEKSKFWFQDIPDNPDLKSLEYKLISENYDDFFKKYPLVYKKCMLGQGEWSKHDFRPNDKEYIAMDIAHTNQKRAHDLAFKILKENINKWWD